MNIMIVDDSTTIRQTVGMILTKSGYHALEACDGNDALEKIEHENIDLFVLDVNMPGMNGISFLKKIRELERYRHAPVIMLTTESSADMMEEGKKAGARAWIIKPFQPETLVEAVKKLSGK